MLTSSDSVAMSAIKISTSRTLGRHATFDSVTIVTEQVRNCPQARNHPRVAESLLETKQFRDGGCKFYEVTAETWPVLFAAALGAVVALAVQVLTTRHQKAESHRSDQTRRLASLLAATHGSVIALGEMAQIAEEAKRELHRDPAYVARQDAVNEQLNAIRLLDSPSVVSLVMELDWCLIQLEQDAEGAVWTEGEWAEHRQFVMSDIVERATNAGRASLGRESLDLKSINNSARDVVVARAQNVNRG